MEIFGALVAVPVNPTYYVAFTGESEKQFSQHKVSLRCSIHLTFHAGFRFIARIKVEHDLHRYGCHEIAVRFSCVPEIAKK